MAEPTSALSAAPTSEASRATSAASGTHVCAVDAGVHTGVDDEAAAAFAAEAAAAVAAEAAAAAAAEAQAAEAAAEATEAEAEEAEAVSGLPELLLSPTLAGLYVIVGRGAPASGGGDEGHPCLPCHAPPEAAAPPLQPWRSPYVAAAAADDEFAVDLARELAAATRASDREQAEQVEELKKAMLQKKMPAA